MRDIQILDTPLSTQPCHDAVADPAAGGIVVFVGAVRMSKIRISRTSPAPAGGCI